MDCGFIRNSERKHPKNPPIPTKLPDHSIGNAPRIKLIIITNPHSQSSKMLNPFVSNKSTFLFVAVKLLSVATCNSRLFPYSFHPTDRKKVTDHSLCIELLRKAQKNKHSAKYCGIFTELQYAVQPRHGTKLKNRVC